MGGGRGWDVPLTPNPWSAKTPYGFQSQCPALEVAISELAPVYHETRMGFDCYRKASGPSSWITVCGSVDIRSRDEDLWFVKTATPAEVRRKRMMNEGGGAIVRVQVLSFIINDSDWTAVPRNRAITNEGCIDAYERCLLPGSQDRWIRAAKNAILPLPSDGLRLRRSAKAACKQLLSLLTSTAPALDPTKLSH